MHALGRVELAAPHPAYLPRHRKRLSPLPSLVLLSRHPAAASPEASAISSASRPFSCGSGGCPGTLPAVSRPPGRQGRPAAIPGLSPRSDLPSAHSSIPSRARCLLALSGTECHGSPQRPPPCRSATLSMAARAIHRRVGGAWALAEWRLLVAGTALAQGASASPDAARPAAALAQ